jgi:hypothetical protein
MTEFLKLLSWIILLTIIALFTIAFIVNVFPLLIPIILLFLIFYLVERVMAWIMKKRK